MQVVVYMQYNICERNYILFGAIRKKNNFR